MMTLKVRSEVSAEKELIPYIALGLEPTENFWVILIEYMMETRWEEKFGKGLKKQIQSQMKL